MGSNAFDKWAEPKEDALRSAGFPEPMISGLMELCWQAVAGHSSNVAAEKEEASGTPSNNARVEICAHFKANCECVWHPGNTSCGMRACVACEDERETSPVA